MKRLKNKSVFISYILLALGAVCLISGLLLGGKADYRISYTRQKVYVGQQNFISGKVSLDNFPFAEIHLDNCKLTIKSDENPCIEYNLPEDYKFTHKITDRKLELSAKQVTMLSFDLSVFSKSPSYIVLTVPEKDFSRLTVKSENGDIIIRDLKTTSLSAKTDNGNISCNNIQSYDLNTETENGDITIDNTEINRKTVFQTGNGNIESSSSSFMNVNGQNENGNISLKDCSLENAVITCKNGDINVTLSDNISNHSFELSSELGDVTFNHKHYGSRVNIPADYTYSNSVIKIQTSLGNINVK